MSGSSKPSSIEDVGSSILNKLPVSSSRRQKVMGYLKAKRDEYVYGGTGSVDGPEDDFSAGAREMQDEILQLNDPFPNEQLILYQSYTRRVDSNEYETNVRGWLYLPGLPNRKGRIIHSLARQIAGVNNNQSATPTSSTGFGSSNIQPAPTPRPPPHRTSTESLIELEDDEDAEIRALAHEAEEQKNRDKSHQISRTSTTSSSSSSMTSSSISSSSTTVDEERRLRDRLAPFLARPAPCRRIRLQVGSADHLHNDELKSVLVTTLPSGKFSAQIRVPYEPSLIHAQASEEVIATEEIVEIPPTGVSVISDIDDTIKHTGITGEKREMFRNVLIRDYEKVGIDGASEWFQKLRSRGVYFHYVSNSPWQLYPAVMQYLKAHNYPPGSMHLKQYSGLLNGLFEPAAERKRANLYKILNDFPHRKFILIGDSGERDLEAYVDIALEYPKQVLAIYLRDVTLPLDDKTFQDNDMNEFLSKTGYIPRPDEINAYENRKRGLENLKSRSTASLKSVGDKIRVSPTNSRSTTPLPAHEISLIDLSDDENVDTTAKQLQPPPLPPRRHRSDITVPKKIPPPVPRKPVGLRSTSTGDKAVSPGTKTVPPPPPPPRMSPSRNNNPYSNSTPSSPQTSTENLAAKQSLDTPPPLPPRRPVSKENQFSMSSTQDDYGQYEVIDKKVENWKNRVTRARCELPAGVRLRMWRKPEDILEESLIVADAHK